MEIDFEKSLNWFLIPMKIVRTHPEIPINLKWLAAYSLTYGPFTVVSVIIIYNSYFNVIHDDFSEACKNGMLSIAYFGASLNNTILLWQRKSINKVLSLMKNDYNNAKNLSEDELKIFHKYVQKKITVCKVWLILIVLSCSLFPVKAVLLMIYHSYIGEPKLFHVHDLVYPDYIERKKGELSMYIVINALICVYSVYAGLVYMSFVPFGPVLMLHACGHLEIINKRIETLISDDLEEVNKKLNEIVKLLQYIYSFVETVKECFTMFYEATIKLSAFGLPVTLYVLLESLKHGELSLEFSSFIISAIALSSTPCYYSDMLMEKGEEVSLSLYTCGWERINNRRARSTIHMLLARCSRPIALKTMFTTLCLDALTDVFQQAYTIFNLLNVVLN